MNLVIILPGREASPGWPPYRVKRPGKAAGLEPLKPFTSAEDLRAWLAGLRRRGVRLVYDGEDFLVWWPTPAPVYQDLALVEVNWDNLARTYVRGWKKPKVPVGKMDTPCYQGYLRYEAPEADPGGEGGGALLALAPPPPIDLDAPISSLPLAFLDLETTGLNPEEDRVTEVGICRVDPGRRPAWLVELVNPERAIPEEVQRKTGITEEMVRDKPPYRVIAPRVAEALSGAVVIAHNAPFDVGFVRAEESRRGKAWEPEAVLCSLELSRRLIRGLTSYALQRIADSLGFPPRSSHRARADVETTMKLWARLMERAPYRVTLRELLRLQEEEPKPFEAPKITPSRRGGRAPETPEEEWAAKALLHLDAEGILGERDQEFGTSLAEQYRSSKKLSEKQWPYVVRIARRYTARVLDEVGPPPR